MRTSNKYILLLVTFAMLLLAMISLQSCKKEGDDNTLGALPDANFDVIPGPNANTVILVNKTSGPSIPSWQISTGQKLMGDSARLNLIFAGTYQVKLIVTAQGGIDSVTKPVTIATSDPTACDPTKAFGFVASCTQKKWKLNPEAGTYKVGEGPDMGNWWSSGAGDVTGRSCEFNDEYTFVFNAAGTFNYDNKGDFFADNNLGPNNGACNPNSAFLPAQQPWASGTFRYTVIEGAGVRSLGQLRVDGLGAHIGLQKAYNGGETGVGAGPAVSSITYDILEMRRNVGGLGYDIMKVGTNIGGAGWWTFTLRSY